MTKKSIASLELAAIINELQFLVKGKIPKIYHQEKEFLFQLHTPQKGKALLKIIPGKLFCLTADKETSIRPSGFCMQLRKYILNASITALYQKEAERIVVFELEKTQKYFLIIELFGQGNLILTDDTYTIITAITKKAWKDRAVKVHEKYIFPSMGNNWKKITLAELAQILHQSDKKNLVTSLAMELGLGGVYAEEICKIISIDKNKKSAKVTLEEVKAIHMAIKGFIKKIETPLGYIYENEITPFKLVGKEPQEILNSYNQAIATLNPFQTVSPYEKKISSLNRIIEEQKEAIKQQEKKIELNQIKGNLVYEKYTPLQKLLAIVTEMKKTKEWGEIEQELKKEKRIKNINLKNKKITIDLSVNSN